MRTRLYVAASVGLVLVSLTGCGGSNDKPSSAPMTEIAVRCDRYADTAKKITDAQKQIYSGTGGGAEAVASLRSELDGLKDGSPTDVKAALTELGDAFEQARQIMADPANADTSALADLGPKLSKDSQKVTAYIVSKCK
jgi:hypothetical protein